MNSAFYDFYGSNERFYNRFQFIWRSRCLKKFFSHSMTGIDPYCRRNFRDGYFCLFSLSIGQLHWSRLTITSLNRKRSLPSNNFNKQVKRAVGKKTTIVSYTAISFVILSWPFAFLRSIRLVIVKKIDSEMGL